MDPNTTLAAARKAWRRARALPGQNTPSGRIVDTNDAAEAFADLDDWLINGGRLPDDWQGSLEQRGSVQRISEARIERGAQALAAAQGSDWDRAAGPAHLGPPSSPERIEEWRQRWRDQARVVLEAAFKPTGAPS